MSHFRCKIDQHSQGHTSNCLNTCFGISQSFSRQNFRKGASRVRGMQRAEIRSFSPPEDWYEASENKNEIKGKNYRFITQPPGKDYRHILTTEQIEERIDALPSGLKDHIYSELEVVQLSTFTKKKSLLPCYGMQWGSSIYLYPLQQDTSGLFIEVCDSKPSNTVIHEAKRFGGKVVKLPDQTGNWEIRWTEKTIKDFYLNNILLHELGHLIDDRNTNAEKRERFAEHFAITHGGPYSHKPAVPRKRHHK